MPWQKLPRPARPFVYEGTGSMNREYTVKPETFDSLSECWFGKGCDLRWNCIFVLSPWLKVWWTYFGTGWIPYFLSVRQGTHLIGIAPLMVRGETAKLMGSPDVCDYLDFIMAPGHERDVLKVLLRHLRQDGIACLDLNPLRADTPLFVYIAAAAGELGYETTTDLEDITQEMGLPATWNGYFQGINGKHRHEIRRKLRRLNEAARVTHRVIEDREKVRDEMGTFLSLFRSNRSDKAAFMTKGMASFFQSIAEAMSEAGFLKLFSLDIDARPAAVTMCFDYKDTMYLYNNAYDLQFRSLSVGVLSKVLSIRESIERGKKRFEFLRGRESYKSRLGGKPVSLYRCRVQIG